MEFLVNYNYADHAPAPLNEQDRRTADSRAVSIDKVDSRLTRNTAVLLAARAGHHRIVEVRVCVCACALVCPWVHVYVCFLFVCRLSWVCR